MTLLKKPKKKTNISGVYKIYGNTTSGWWITEGDTRGGADRIMAEGEVHARTKIDP